MSFYHCAADRVGETVLIIRNNAVIGKGYTCLQRGDLFIGITLHDEAAQALLDISTDPDLQALGYRRIFIKYDPTTGDFLPELNLEKVCEAMKNTLIVDEFNFRWGMVPDKFKDVPGYRGAPTEVNQGE